MPTTIVVFLPPSRSNPFDARNEYCQFHDYAGPFVTILNYANNDTFYDYILFSIFRKNVIRNRLRLSPETLYCAVSVCETLFFANARRKNCINLVHVWLGQDAKRIDVPFPNED